MIHAAAWRAAAGALVACAGTTSCSWTSAHHAEDVASISPATLSAVGKVDERFQSYNVEMVEVTGGNFWAPYPKPGEPQPQTAAGPHGVEFASSAYSRREPLDLRNKRLRILASALGPAYMRVSGSWANSIYFQDNDQPAPPTPPQGYQGVLTRQQWAGVVDFAKAVDAKILTSFATSVGARGPDGKWSSEGAQQLLTYTRSLGGHIDAVELTNEPNVCRPPFRADAFARDQTVLRDLLAKESPETKLVGPGSTGEAGFKLFSAPPKEINTSLLLSGEPQPRFDIFSYHFYGAVSQRCTSLGKNATTSAADALEPGWLDRAEQARAYYADVRNRFAPGAPIWITEASQSACGGDPWAATFIDTFRYVDQLGQDAKGNVAAVFHNTLAASDYSLIDDVTRLPRPNYWAALLWRRLMGEVVLDPGAAGSVLRAYAHCMRHHPGGVTLVVLNVSRTATGRLRLHGAAERYTLTADSLQSTSMKLNGRALALTSTDDLPVFRGVPARAGTLSFAPTSITFLTVPDAANSRCQ